MLFALLSSKNQPSDKEENSTIDVYITHTHKHTHMRARAREHRTHLRGKSNNDDIVDTIGPQNNFRSLAVARYYADFAFVAYERSSMTKTDYSPLYVPPIYIIFVT